MFGQSSDDELMAAVATGSDSAFRRLFDRHGAAVLGYCRRLMGDSTRGEDMAQNTWMKIVRAAPSYRGEGKFKGWMLSIARHTCFSEMRLQSSQLELPTEEIGEVDNGIEAGERESVEDMLSRHQSVAAVKKLIDALPDSQRVALMLWMSEELSYSEIALAMKLSEAAVKSLLFRARQSLDQRLKVGT